MPLQYSSAWSELIPPWVTRTSFTADCTASGMFLEFLERKTPFCIIWTKQYLISFKKLYNIDWYWLLSLIKLIKNFNSRALRSFGCLSKTEGNNNFQFRNNTFKLIQKPNSSKKLFHVVFITHTTSLKSVMQSFSQRWGSTDFKHTMYCGLGKEVGRALPSNKKAPNTSMKTQVVWLRRIKMKETYPAIKKQV